MVDRSVDSVSYSAHKSPALLSGDNIPGQNNVFELVCLRAFFPTPEAAAGRGQETLGSLDLHTESSSIPSWCVISGRPLNIFKPQFPDI